MIVAMSCYDMPPSTPAGRELREQIFPGWGFRIERVADDGRRRLRAMVNRRLRKHHTPLWKRIKAENGHDVVETALWDAARELCVGKSLRDLVLMVLRGELRLFARRAANRVQNYDRGQYGGGVETTVRVQSPDGQENEEIKRRHFTELTMRLETLETVALDWKEGWNGTLDDRHKLIDVQRAIDDLAVREPALYRGCEIFIAREIKKVDWETLEARYGYHRTTLTKWMRAARKVIQRGLTQ